eukprot:12889403-Prorocentrum_lima.AAC.1
MWATTPTTLDTTADQTASHHLTDDLVLMGFCSQRRGQNEGCSPAVLLAAGYGPLRQPRLHTGF